MTDLPSMKHQPFHVLNAGGGAPMVIICDHASNRVPAELADLGLPESELQRHIAWDIGAAAIAEALSARFNAPAVICGTSRLVIDCNRYPDARDAVPETSDRTPIPGNRGLSAADRQARIDRYFHPYHDAVEATVARKIAAGQVPVVVSVHSMTPALGGVARPWQIAASSYQDRRLTDPLLLALRRVPGIMVGDNQPYALDPAEDYSIPEHAMRRGLAHVQVEFRQDEVATPEGAAAWARIFADALASAINNMETNRAVSADADGG
jgi:predicted N-formylglutamate amidohydrolase